MHKQIKIALKRILRGNNLELIKIFSIFATENKEYQVFTQ